MRPGVTASRRVVRADGEGDPLNNPTRVAPRHLVDLGLGVDNLLRTEHQKLNLRFSVINLTNTEALYNFLSTFSGTHFVTPRAYRVQAGRSKIRVATVHSILRGGVYATQLPVPREMGSRVPDRS